MSEIELGFCPRPHPFGATYRLCHIVYTKANQRVENPRWPRAKLCPWCDWQRLRGPGPRRDASEILKLSLKKSLR
jgi:hypothetical protein